MRRHPATTATFVVLFWTIAAAMSIAARLATGGQTAVTIVVLLLTAYAYIRLTAREAGSAHALAVGIAWLVMTIATEVALSTQDHGWFSLLGPPDRPLLRNLILILWIFSPALFARDGQTLRNH